MSAWGRGRERWVRVPSADVLLKPCPLLSHTDDVVGLGFRKRRSPAQDGEEKAPEGYISCPLTNRHHDWHVPHALTLNEVSGHVSSKKNKCGHNCPDARSLSHLLRSHSWLVVTSTFEHTAAQCQAGIPAPPWGCVRSSPSHEQTLVLT